MTEARRENAEQSDRSGLFQRFYPESNISGFTYVDGTVSFYTQIAAVLKPTHHVLDVGAGRGGPQLLERNDYKRALITLKGRCKHLEGCDLDEAVLTNPFLDHAEVLEPGGPLPYPSDHFDIVLAQSVFEHVTHPEQLANELLRVVKSGGLIAAVTPNKYGYIGIAVRMVPNRFHVAMLERAQPERRPEDVFPTRYRMNTRRILRKLFGHEADVHVVRFAPEPAYHWGNPTMFRLIKWVNKHLPSAMQPVLHIYIRKH